jgi:hypothetical protein
LPQVVIQKSLARGVSIVQHSAKLVTINALNTAEKFNKSVFFAQVAQIPETG